MAGVPSKRHRDDAEIEEISEGEELKRQKSFDQILSLLDEEEEEPNEDLSSIITTLQQEISSTSSMDPQQCHETESNQENRQPTTTGSGTVEDYTNSSSSSSSSAASPSFTEVLKVDEDGERERVMRHLLEASDDELGIPNGDFLVHEGVDAIHRGGLSLCDALWELEDEAANYYTLFQSQLFM